MEVAVSTIDTRPVTSPPGWRRVDIATVAAVLYIGPFLPSEWDHFGPTRMARYVVAVVADPRMPIDVVVDFLTHARRDPGHPVDDLDKLSAADEFATRVMTALELACQS
jgi:hypothetical protein